MSARELRDEWRRHVQACPTCTVNGIHRDYLCPEGRVLAERFDRDKTATAAPPACVLCFRYDLPMWSHFLPFCSECLQALRELVSAKRHHADPSLADRLREIHEKPDPEKR